MDLYGQDEAVNQLNSRNQFVDSYNQGVADFNNTIMNQYNQAKDGETQTDDLSYAKDAINNVMSGAGMKGAWDNRKFELNRAVNKGARLLKEAEEGLGEVKSVAGSNLIRTAREVPSGGLSGALGFTKTQKVFLPDKGQFPADNPDRPMGVGAPPPVPTEGAGAPDPATTPPQAGSGVEADMTPAKPGEPTKAGANGLLTDAEAEADGEGHGIVAHALNKMTGIGLDAGEQVGKIGGAVTSAGMGGVALYGDIKNMIDNDGDPFKKDATWEDDINNVGSIVQGVGDIVGIVPGLEWVAGLSNIIGAGTSAIGMFGDHRANEKHDQNVENMKNQLKDNMSRVSGAGNIVQSAPSQAQQQIGKAQAQGAY